MKLKKAILATILPPPHTVVIILSLGEKIKNFLHISNNL
jgi:hypothetical protein